MKRGRYDMSKPFMWNLIFYRRPRRIVVLVPDEAEMVQRVKNWRSGAFVALASFALSFFIVLVLRYK